jgi:hypothetical protein
MRYLLIGLLVLPVYADAPIIEGRQIHHYCDKGYCVVSEEDWDYIVRRNKLFEQLIEELSIQAKKCSFKGA